MEKITVETWDPAEEIETQEDIIAELELALEENNAENLLEVLGDIARSKGMAQLARNLNLNREGLYTSLSAEGNPSFKTVFKLLDLLGLRLKVEPKIA